MSAVASLNAAGAIVFVVIIASLVATITLVATTTTRAVAVTLPRTPILPTPATRARRLLAGTSFGALATMDEKLGVFNNVVSFSDGTDRRANATGVPFFCLTTMDATARNLEKDTRASFVVTAKDAVADYAPNACRFLDAQEPPCPKLTLSGKLTRLGDPADMDLARRAIVARHPAVRAWPRDHSFAFYKLDIQNVFFLDHYGGATPISPKEFLDVEL